MERDEGNLGREQRGRRELEKSDPIQGPRAKVSRVDPRRPTESVRSSCGLPDHPRRPARSLLSLPAPASLVAPHSYRSARLTA